MDWYKEALKSSTEKKVQKLIEDLKKISIEMENIPTQQQTDFKCALRDLELSLIERKTE